MTGSRQGRFIWLAGCVCHLALATIICAQKTVPDRLIVAWVLPDGFRGHWMDETDGRALEPGRALYADSRIVRHAPLLGNDMLPLHLRTGDRFYDFHCSSPHLCDDALPIGKLFDPFAPRFYPTWRKIETTLARARDDDGTIVHDVAIADSPPMPAVFQGATREPSFAVAWCLNALNRREGESCAGTPVPITVVWHPSSQQSLLPLDNVPRGLHRLVRIHKASGTWVYDDQGAWVLRTDSAHLREITGRLTRITQEWQGVTGVTALDLRRMIVSAMAEEIPSSRTSAALH